MKRQKRKRYTVNYFIKLFSKLKDADIGKGGLAQHCALWHCGVRNTTAGGNYALTHRAIALGELLGARSRWDAAVVVFETNDKDFLPARRNMLDALEALKGRK